ncbi:hypothetical protein CJF32_00010585 [Rutstroemia sp. NJR-2017a WRK4]|nr:hypothetical protein CJF32_00010585 [Rutstroemia sp. NJR-2017a WRK4]
MEVLKKIELLSDYSGIETGHLHKIANTVVQTISVTRLYTFVTPGCPNTSPKATVGTLIGFAGKRFYFTVSHVFSKNSAKDPKSVFDNADDEDDSDFEFGGFGDGEDVIDEEMDITGSDSITSVSSGLPDDFNEDFIESLGISDPAGSKETAKLPSEMVESQSKESLKLKSQVPFQILPDNRETENSDMKIAAVYLVSTNLDYALIELDSEHDLTPASKHLPIISLESAGKIPPGETNILTVTGSRGLLFGVLSCRPSHVRLISATTFQEAFKVKIEGPLILGDSGAIVMSSETGEVYGYMILGSTASRIAYIIPAINVLKDLKLREDHIQETTSEAEAPTFQPEHNDEETTPRESEFRPDSETLLAVTAPVVDEAENSKMDAEGDSSPRTYISSLSTEFLAFAFSDYSKAITVLFNLGSIYSGAERVIIWLGEATYDSNYVIHHRKHLENKGSKHISNAQEILEKQWANTWSLVVRNLGRDQRVKSLYSLLHRSWFERVWVIQEFVNAQVPQIRSGRKSVLAKFGNSEAIDPGDKIHILLGISSTAYDAKLRADYKKILEDTTLVTTLLLLNLKELDAPIRHFFESTLLEFLGNLVALANKEPKNAKYPGHKQVVRPLLETSKVDVNSRDYDSEMLLLWAVENGNEAVVNLLLDRDAELEAKGKWDRTPLSCAAKSGYEAVVKLLLQVGAKWDFKDKLNETPLPWATKSRHKAAVKLLLQARCGNEGIRK